MKKVKISKILMITALAGSLSSCTHNQSKNNTSQTDTAADTASVKADTSTTAAQNGKTTDLQSSSEPIIPGKSIGKTAIDQNGDKLFSNLGKPDDEDSAMGKSTASWYADHNKTGYVIQAFLARGQADDAIKKVKFIRVTSPHFKVNNDIHIGTALTFVQGNFKLIKTATFKEKGADRILYDDTEKGIAFDTDSKGIITGIAVFERGRKASEIYQAFFSDLK